MQMDRRFGLEPALKAGGVFHILVVDDDRAGAELLRVLMKNLRVRYELHFVWDGVEALDFLRRRGAYADVPSPNLVLLDINMPRLGGLETLSAIKSDPELYVIPVIMLSTSNSPDDVRESYQARANCFVQKPVDLERSVKLLQAIETFWMDFVLLPTDDDRSRKNGPQIAPKSGEARSRAMCTKDLQDEKTARPSGCEEHNSLLDQFGNAVRELLFLHEQQFMAIVEGDGECSRFDLLIHMANEYKQSTKYAYLRHVEAHGCSRI
jgi:chemotaxis family two-component system response regulator Rcp1